ncbi:extracellular solute-binding protein [Paenibacillus alba]|uniref:extracellular solute-binding protein n=1 Tax=Paenibacillus alba TaxID=1197127 RepID=UPI001565CAB2|nr:extracellular solute-binding protein [Paenibacillus alba]NQX70311.1 extracellular solute-binding protein [Paenibacillus alba]
MKKKFVILTLAAVLTTTAAAGCSNGNQAAVSPSASGKAAEAPKSPTKFSISFPTTISTGYHTRVDVNKDKWTLKLEQLTNTDLDVKVLEDSKMSVMFAGGDIPDVVGSVGTPTSKSMSGSVEAGVFMPLDDLLKTYAPNMMKAIPKSAWAAVSYKGKIYGLPEFLTNPSRRGTFIRMDLLEKSGLPAPQTVEDFLNVLRAFKKLGVENPYQMRDSFKYSDILFGAYDVLPYKDQFEVVNGQVVPKFFDSENMQKALQGYKTMLDEGLIPKDFASVSSTDYTKNINGARAGSWSGNVSGLPGYRTNVKQIVPDGKVEVITSPKGPEGKGGYLFYAPIVRAFYVNSKVKPDTAISIIKFFDWMLTPEAAEFFTFGTEGETYTVDGSGKVTYKFPTTKEGNDEEGWRSGTLWAIHDSTINKMKMELDPSGQDTVAALENVVSKEGLSGIGFYPDLAAFTKFPDLVAQGDTGPKLIIDHMIKMIYGKEPITDWPKVIEEYKQKGGSEVIKEATERYNTKDGVIVMTK